MTGERRTRPWCARLRLRLRLRLPLGVAVPGCCPARAHTTGYSRRILAVLHYLGTPS
ncbi:hypothetical protein ACGGAQ_21920 [Micromonospora sp. NPDC047557]|uniref:hypothetical protein n=1 Tax=Micromonospora sp. NPDC047557 TaxID=3364250 RepID=UPI003715DA38